MEAPEPRQVALEPTELAPALQAAPRRRRRRPAVPLPPDAELIDLVDSQEQQEPGGGRWAAAPPPRHREQQQQQQQPPSGALTIDLTEVEEARLDGAAVRPPAKKRRRAASPERPPERRQDVQQPARAEDEQAAEGPAQPCTICFDDEISPLMMHSFGGCCRALAGSVACRCRSPGSTVALPPPPPRLTLAAALLLPAKPWLRRCIAAAAALARTRTRHSCPRRRGARPRSGLQARLLPALHARVHQRQGGGPRLPSALPPARLQGAAAACRARCVRVQRVHGQPACGVLCARPGSSAFVGGAPARRWSSVQPPGAALPCCPLRCAGAHLCGRVRAGADAGGAGHAGQGVGVGGRAHPTLPEPWHRQGVGCEPPAAPPGSLASPRSPTGPRWRRRRRWARARACSAPTPSAACCWCAPLGPRRQRRQLPQVQRVARAGRVWAGGRARSASGIQELAACTACVPPCRTGADADHPARLPASALLSPPMLDRSRTTSAPTRPSPARTATSSSAPTAAWPGTRA